MLVKPYFVKYCILLFISLTAFVRPVLAGPWVETEDIFLRTSIQQLADAGFLKSNVTTYPLMWNGIARDLREIDVTALSESERYAFYRVRAALQFAQRPSSTGMRLQVSNASGVEDLRFNSFGNEARETISLRTSREFIGENVAGRLQTSFRLDAIDDKSYTFEGSYLATTIGNWAFSVDQMPAWWGPGVDNALVLSTNSTPIQAFRLNRMEDTPIPVWGLRALGSANATAFLGRTQSSASLGDQQVSGLRASLRPHKKLAVGASYLSHWESFGDWYNRMTGVDARFSITSHWSAYTELATNHRAADDVAFTLGTELYLGSINQQRQLFIEATDVPADFYQRSAFVGKFIEVDGYRRWLQSIGATQDQDVTVIMGGIRSQHANGDGWQFKIRYAEYGNTNLPMSLKYALQQGDSVERTELEGYYQHPWRDAMLTISASLYYDSVDYNSLTDFTSQSKTGVNISASWEFRF